ncbi:MAG: DUF3060 domain-containing protein [Candidatus Methanoperedens sp.]|nr:DUF3060 domain-containing protein [Candidatus Methanoperedens sp.]
MTNKAILLLILIVGFSISGCSAPSESQMNPTPTQQVRSVYVTPEPTSQPTIQDTVIISGIQKNVEISGKRIEISGIENNVKILNSDVDTIIISGNQNNISYPKSANPKITESGVQNIVHTY